VVFEGLNPGDSYLWVMLKDKLCVNVLHVAEEQKENSQWAVSNISQEDFYWVFWNVWIRCEACQQAQGHHFLTSFVVSGKHNVTNFLVMRNTHRLLLLWNFIATKLGMLEKLLTCLPQHHVMKNVYRRKKILYEMRDLTEWQVRQLVCLTYSRKLCFSVPFGFFRCCGRLKV
jgi:hypothetical protein